MKLIFRHFILCKILFLVVLLTSEGESNEPLSKIPIIFNNGQRFDDFKWETVDVSIDENNGTRQQSINITLIEAGSEVFLHYIQNFISSDEADLLITLCDQRDGWRKSPIRAELATTISTSGDGTIDGDTGNADKFQKRTSSSCPLLWPISYQKLEQDPNAYGKISDSILNEFTLTNMISKRAAKLLKIDQKHVEPLQIVRYHSGEFYQVHHDHGGYYGFATEHRSYTLLLFLNTVPETDGGGHTSFPMLNLKVLPQKQGSFRYYRTLL